MALSRHLLCDHADCCHVCPLSIAVPITMYAKHFISRIRNILTMLKNFVFWDKKTPVLTSQETHSVSATETRPLMLCKISGSHGSDYEEFSLLGYITPVLISQETHYVSDTETSRLMLCNVSGFHGGDCEECHLLGYTKPVRTSQKTHYVSLTETSSLMLCKI
jgi:hypothetical protein